VNFRAEPRGAGGEGSMAHVHRVEFPEGDSGCSVGRIRELRLEIVRRGHNDPWGRDGEGFGVMGGHGDRTSRKTPKKTSSWTQILLNFAR
jgi:hypothetical protein